MSKQWAGLIILGLVSATPALAAGQADAKGFVEDSSLDLFLRNAYISRDYKQGKQDKAEWGQGAVASLASGFTQGTVGVGADAFAIYGLRLDGGRGRSGAAGIDFFRQDNDGEPARDVAKAGAALKLRFSNTVIAHGDLRPTLPVLNHDNSRLLPESFTGTMLTSNEIDGLQVHAGRFHAESRKSDEGRDSGGLKGIDVIGGSYTFSDTLSAAVYASDVEDVLKRQYVNLNYTLPLASDSLNFDLNAYRTRQDRKFDPDEGRNNIWSLAATYATGPHAFTIAHQRSTGDVGYNYGFYQDEGWIGDGGSTIFLANSYWSDFNAKDERSWQLSYAVDFAEYGVPGLSYRVAYVRGDNIDAGAPSRGEEREWFNQLSYKVQSGGAKDLNIRLRASALRVSQDARAYNSEGNEVRVFVDYPLNLF